MAQPQQSIRGGASQMPASPADVFGDSHQTRMAFLQTSIDEHGLITPVTGTGSAPQFFTFPQAGLLRRIRLHVSGTVALVQGTGGLSWSKDGVYKILNRVFFLDVGNATRFDCSGTGLYQIGAATTDSGHDPAFSTVTTSESSAIYSAPALTSTSQSFAFWVDLPFVYSEWDLRGLCNLNSPGRQCEFYLQLVNGLTGASSTDATYPILATGTASATLTDITIQPEIWTYTPTVQQSKGGQQPVLPVNDMMIVQEIVESYDNLTVGGETYHLMAPGRSIHQVMQTLFQNGAQTVGTINVDSQNTSGGVNHVRVKYDNRNTPIDIRLSDFYRNNRDRCERDFNFIYHDFRKRPWDSVLTPQLQVGFTLTSDATSATTNGPSYLRTTQRNLYRTTSVQVAGSTG